MATEYPPLGKSFVLSYSNNDRNFPIIAIRKDPRVENYKIPEDLSPHPETKRYPNHVFTGAQPTNSDERVQWVYEILPAPWVPFTRYDDDLGPIQGRRRFVKNEGQVASLTANTRTTYEARDGSAIVYTEIEESWSTSTDDDGNSLFPVKDRDTYDNRFGAIKERRQLFVPTGDERASLEYQDPTITQITYEPYNEYLSFKITTSYNLSGPIRREDIYDPVRGPVQRISQVIYDSGNLEGSLVRQDGTVTQTSYQPVNNLVVDRVVETYSSSGPIMQGRMIDSDGNIATLSRQVVASGTEADSGYKITSSSIAPENKEIGIKQTVKVDKFPVLSGAQIDPRYGVVLQYTKELVDASTAVGGVSNLESVEIEPKNQWHSWKLTTRISQLPNDQVWYGYRKESFPDVLIDLKIVGTETYQPVPTWRVAPDTPLRARYTRKFSLGPPQEEPQDLSPKYWAEPFYAAIEYLRVSQSESSTTSNSTSSGTNTSSNNSISNVVSDGTQQSLNSSNSQSSSTSDSYQQSSGTGTSSNRSESSGTNENVSRSSSFSVSESKSFGTSKSETQGNSTSTNNSISYSSGSSESTNESQSVSSSFSQNIAGSNNDGGAFSFNKSGGLSSSTNDSQTTSRATSKTKSTGKNKSISKTNSESSVESEFETENKSENTSESNQTGSSTSTSTGGSKNFTNTVSQNSSTSSGTSSGSNSGDSNSVNASNNYTSVTSALQSSGESSDITQTDSGTSSRQSIYTNKGRSESDQIQRNDSNSGSYTISSFSGTTSQSSTSESTSNVLSSGTSESNSQNETESESKNKSNSESKSTGKSKSTNKSNGENTSEGSVDSDGTTDSDSRGSQNSITNSTSSSETSTISEQGSYSVSNSTVNSKTTSSSTSSSIGTSSSESSTNSYSSGSSNANNSSSSSSTGNNETNSTSDTKSTGSGSGIQNTSTSSTSSSTGNSLTTSSVDSNSTSESSGQTWSTNNSNSTSTSSGSSSSVNFSTSQNSTTSKNKSIFSLSLPKCLRRDIGVTLPSGDTFNIPATRQTDLNWGSYVEVARQSEHWKQGIWITEITEVYLPEI